ncbi:hypothetical protein TWF679_000308 [Orbilia oligospora]|uniref:Uncharacterized protein n=1 Tax=Orbilia oligospora TaxID=2813651 RepID=A0A8H8VNN7_ORBOL|nr:hypothetical protein TWF679_000308 [Orbilia oligospora]
MSSFQTPILKKPPVSAESLRSSLLQHLNRYGVIVHSDGPNALTAEEVQAQRDAGVPEDVIKKVYFSEPDPTEQRSKAYIIQKLVLQDLDQILTEINGVNSRKDIQGRLTGLVGLILGGIAFLLIRRPIGIYLGLESALRVLRGGSIRNILSQTINKLYNQSPSFWFFASITSVVSYLVAQDTRRWIGVDSVTDVLKKMRENVARFERVKKSDIHLITGWRWNSVPWKDHQREIGSEEYEIAQGS